MTWDTLRHFLKKIARVDCLKLKRKDGSFRTADLLKELIEKVIAELKKKLTNPAVTKLMAQVESEAKSAVSTNHQHINLRDLNQAFLNLKSVCPEFIGDKALSAYILPIWKLQMFEEPSSRKNTRNLYYALCALPDKPLIFFFKYDITVPYEEFLKQFPLCPAPKSINYPF